jgi:hypothetical protein
VLAQIQFRITECSLVGKAPGLGPGDRRFESFHSDQKYIVDYSLESVYINNEETKDHNMTVEEIMTMLLEKAINLHTLSVDAKNIHEAEKFLLQAASFVESAEDLLRGHGDLYNDWIEHDLFMIGRKIKRKCKNF